MRDSLLPIISAIYFHLLFCTHIFLKSPHTISFLRFSFSVATRVGPRSWDNLCSLFSCSFRLSLVVGRYSTVFGYFWLVIGFGMLSGGEKGFCRYVLFSSEKWHHVGKGLCRWGAFRLNTADGLINFSPPPPYFLNLYHDFNISHPIFVPKSHTLTLSRFYLSDSHSLRFFPRIYMPN